MACKLISVEDAAIATPLLWQGAAPGAASSQQCVPGPATEPEKPSEDERAKREAEHVRVLVAQQAKIQELERELESRPRQAYQRGHTEGQAAGAQQANARLEPVLAKLAESLRELTTVRKRHLLEAEEDAVRLAVAVARKILHREMSVDPDSLLGVVRAAFERVDARDVHRVRLNPEDVPSLQRHLAAAGLPPRLELVADTTLERGSVILETSRGSLDASVSLQLREIEQGLVDMVRRSS